MTADAQLQTVLPDLQRDVPLSRFTSFRLGGPARYLLVARDVPTIVRAASVARAAGLPFVILGGGSNTLVAPTGFPGLVVIAAAAGLTATPPRLVAEAGVKLSVLIVRAAQAGLGGLSCLSGVPGTVGGAIVGNAGGRTDWISHRTVSVRVVSAVGEEASVPRDDCGFDYRESRFKTSGEIVLSAELELLPGAPAALLAEHVWLIREKNQKQPTSAQSAGCMFKNARVVDPMSLPAFLRETVVDGQVSAWRLITAAGLSGQRIGGVRVSERHANFFVNDGTGTVDDVLALLSLVKQRVRKRFGVPLTEEVRLLGFDPPAGATTGSSG